MKRTHQIDGQEQLDFGGQFENGQMVEQHLLIDAEERAEATKTGISMAALAELVTRDDDEYDRYVEQGTMSHDEARALRAGISVEKLNYLDKRHADAMKSISAIPGGPVKDAKITEINHRFSV